VESVPGRRKETEEERNERKKREYYEKKKQQEKQREREKGHHVRPAAGSSKGTVNGSRDAYGDKKVAVGGGEKIENRLKRPSTFLCKIK
jgi:RNA polymerase II-associated factor 1